MKRYDVWLDQTRLRYLRQYVRDTSNLKTGVSTAIRKAIDDLLISTYPNYTPTPIDKRGRRKQVAGV